MRASARRGRRIAGIGQRQRWPGCRGTAAAPAPHPARCSAATSTAPAPASAPLARAVDRARAPPFPAAPALDAGVAYPDTTPPAPAQDGLPPAVDARSGSATPARQQNRPSIPQMAAVTACRAGSVRLGPHRRAGQRRRARANRGAVVPASLGGCTRISPAAATGTKTRVVAATRVLNQRSQAIASVRILRALA